MGVRQGSITHIHSQFSICLRIGEDLEDWSSCFVAIECYFAFQQVDIFNHLLFLRSID